MKNSCNGVLLMLAIGTGIAMSGPALAVTSAVGPYYATPSWDQTLPAATRFIVLTNMNSEAVLDRETGLVWEQSPSTSPFDWFNAVFRCVKLSKGGRKGWYLPTIQDLASLIDPTVPSPGPMLPAGHPFGNMQLPVFWSATPFAGGPAVAWFEDFVAGNEDAFGKNSIGPRAWCVRGGQGPDIQ